MDRDGFFEKNILALSRRNPELCARLRAVRPGPSQEARRYRFLALPSGGALPAALDETGAARPLHSTVNPEREAQRLVSPSGGGETGAGFFVFLGLGGGFAPAAALSLPGASGALAIDYDAAGVAELLGACDYAALLGDPRFSLLVDPSPAHIESAILESYSPALSGGIRVLPLRARIERDRKNFGEAGGAARRAIEKVSADYSAQAHFGGRWFANIIRNVIAARFPPGGQGRQMRVPSPREAAICAAGPSLDAHIPLLLERKARGGGEPFVISADTALPALMGRGLRPDAVVSIDCQHISYHHFMGLDCRKIPLFLDIASPPALYALSDSALFFAGGHPLAMYLRAKWAPLPVLDVSGGNVAFACLSLAESLGARRISVYGADFSYPAGRIYARGSYVFPFFAKRQSRLSPLEAQSSSLLFRSHSLPPEGEGGAAGASRYETATMRAYRLSFARKASEMAAQVSVEPGLGIHVAAEKRLSRPPAPGFAPAGPAAKGEEFLERYGRDIEALPALACGEDPGGYARALGGDARQVFATLLPGMAWAGRMLPELAPRDLFEEVKKRCAGEIRGALAGRRESGNA